MDSGGRPTILVFIRWYAPGFKSGGPVRSLQNMIRALHSEFRFRVVTSDRDSGDAQSYPGVTPGEWARVDFADVLYLATEQRRPGTIGPLLRHVEHDCVYLNSLFDPRFTLTPLLAKSLWKGAKRPVIVAPRGELNPGALALKWKKKSTFLRAAKASRMLRNVNWHATTAEEASEIRRWFGDRAQVSVAPNISSLAREEDSAAPAKRAVGERLQVVFLSRLDRKKNLTAALEVLGRAGVPVNFDVFGPCTDPNYRQQCEQQAKRLPSEVQVRFCGPIPPKEVGTTLANYDLFFLPTLGENYCHAIAESLGAGCPLLISDRTPWRNLERLGVGWDLPLGDVEPFCQAIRRCAAMNADERRRMRENAFQYVRSLRREEETHVQAHRELFTAAIQAGSF